MALQLRRTPTDLPRLTLQEFWSRRQLIREVEPLTEEAYRRMEDEQWRAAFDTGHGEPWHVSFHGSQFPGDDPNWCPRAALYRMMNFPAREPWKRRLRAAADTGKAIEKDLVRRWDWSGILLSPPPSEDGSHDDQLRFEYADLWLTGTADAVIRSRYDQSLPVPIEVKTKWHDVIEQMHLGVRGPDPAHIKQCKTEIAFVRAAMENGSLWPDSGLKFPTYGVIYYASRDDSSFTAEFRVDYDPHYWEVGCRVLAAVQEAYHADVLPQADDADQRRRHPMGAGWKWSQNACQYCDYKREICRKDHKYQVSKLSESNGTRWAEKVRGVPYDAATERARVLERWEGRTGTPRPIVASEVAA